MVISFSGIDGAGKTTQINNLLEYCKENDLSCMRKWSKARGTPGIMFLKRLVRRDKNMPTEEKLQHRNKVYQSGWKKKLLLLGSLLDLCWYWGIYFRHLKKKFDILILDRYIWDTYVEVSTEFGIDSLKKSLLWRIVNKVALKPTFSVLLEISPEESLRRDFLKCEITTDALQLKEDKISIYLDLKAQNSWNVIIDATQSVEQTFDELLQKTGIRPANKSQAQALNRKKS